MSPGHFKSVTLLLSSVGHYSTEFWKTIQTFGSRLAPDARTVQYPIFENAILKVEQNRIGMLTFEEKAALRVIEKYTNSTT